MIVRVSTDGLKQATGQQWISERMVQLAMTVFVVFIVKVIVTTPAAAPAAAAGGGRGGGTLDNAMVDKIYASGFNDGSEGKLYGASLGQYLKTSVGGVDSDGEENQFTDEFANNYVPPGGAMGGMDAAPAKASLGWSDTFSLAIGGKLIFDLGKGAAGGWNPANFATNAQTLGPMRMIMPGMALMRVAPKLIAMVTGR